MSTPLTRQDMLAITDTAKNKILERLVSRYDVQGAADSARDRILNTINALHIENQTLLRQVNNLTDQSQRRIVNIETQVVSLRQEVRMLTHSINRLYEVQTMHQVKDRQQSNTEQRGYNVGASPSSY